MDVGSIGFHDRSKVKSMQVEKDNSIVNAINRTKQVSFFCIITFVVLFLLFSILHGRKDFQI